MSHLVPVEVIGDYPIVSVIGYREDEEWQFSKDGRPLFELDGSPKLKKVIVEITEDVEKGGIAYLDPSKTKIYALTQSQLVRPMPKKQETKAGKGA